MSLELVNHANYQFLHPNKKLITLDDEVYPSVIEEEALSFWGRFKKAIANLLADAMCGVGNRSYEHIFRASNRIQDGSLPPV